MNLSEHKKVDGYWRPNGPIAEPGIESGQFTKVNAVTKRVNNNEQNKVFAYSKVINGSKLHQLCKEDDIEVKDFNFQPYINCIAIDDYVVGYIWDTREIITAVKNKELAGIWNNVDWEDCVPDFYNGQDDKPMLLNPHNLDVGKAMEYAKGWMQPKCFITLYKVRRGGANATSMEYGAYEICTFVKGKGECLIGLYDAWPPRNKYVLEMSYDLLKDVWPHIKKSCEKFTKFTSTKPMTWLDVQHALMDGLTI